MSTKGSGLEILGLDAVQLRNLIQCVRSSAAKGDQKSIEVLTQLANESFLGLIDLLQSGEIRALPPTLDLLCSSIQKFSQHVEKNRQTYRAVARHYRSWPVLLPAQPSSKKAVINFLATELELGADYPMNLEGKSSAAVETRIAEYLIERMLTYSSSYRGKIPEMIRALPPFTTGSAAMWWEIAKPLFYESYGRNFEDHQVFASYWRKIYPKWMRPNDKRKRIQDNILSNMHKAFLRIAKKRAK